LYTAVYSIIIFIQSKMIRGAAHAGLIQWQLHIKFLFENHNRRQLGRLGYRWEDSIKMDLKIIRGEGVDYIHLSQQRGQWWPCVQAIITIHVLLQAENLTSWALYKHSHKHYSMEGGREGWTEVKETMKNTGQRLCIWSERDNCQVIFALSTTKVQKSTVQSFWTCHVLLIMCTSAEACFNITHQAVNYMRNNKVHRTYKNRIAITEWT
jgi:hypothetical protein